VQIGGEPLATRLNAFTRFINSPEFVAIIFEIVRPSTETGRDFQNRADWQAMANARENRRRPLRGGAAPGGRPLLARFVPIVLHGITRPIDDDAFITVWLPGSHQILSAVRSTWPYTARIIDLSGGAPQAFFTALKILSHKHKSISI